jgi:hypothetical protein
MITDIDVVKCMNIYKCVEKYDWPTHKQTHTHKWAGILLVSLIRNYDYTSLLRIHRIGMTLAVGHQWQWK